MEEEKFVIQLVVNCSFDPEQTNFGAKQNLDLQFSVVLVNLHKTEDQASHTTDNAIASESLNPCYSAKKNILFHPGIKSILY